VQQKRLDGRIGVLFYGSGTPKRTRSSDGALRYSMHTEDLLTPKPERPSGIGEKDGNAREPASWKSSEPSWRGDSFFLLSNLVAKDFKVRYRNMSLGVFWSLLNPLVLMGVLTFVFTKVTRNNSVPHFPAFVMCGLVPFNFFSIGWTSGTTSLVDNSAIIKRVPIPREMVPLASVISNCLHLLIQIFLLLVLVLVSGLPMTLSWIWLPYLWTMEIIFVCGLSLVTSAVNVYVRDTRYVVESINTVMFWAVPVVYSFSVIPSIYAEVYKLNPLAALILAMRDILLEGHAPRWELLVKLTLVAAFTFVFGLAVFQKLKRRFYDHL
jgi:lipopolysaccharide transport system permease protein